MILISYQVLLGFCTKLVAFIIGFFFIGIQGRASHDLCDEFDIVQIIYQLVSRFVSVGLIFVGGFFDHLFELRRYSRYFRYRIVYMHEGNAYRIISVKRNFPCKHFI